MPFTTSIVILDPEKLDNENLKTLDLTALPQKLRHLMSIPLIELQPEIQPAMLKHTKRKKIKMRNSQTQLARAHVHMCAHVRAHTRTHVHLHIYILLLNQKL